MSAKIITVWGSPASGKTILALAIGAHFADEKKNVIIIDGSKLIPGLSVYMPKDKFTSADSIGPLLMSNRYTDQELAQRIKPHEKSEYLAFMGLSSAENYITYHEFSKESVIRMINKLGTQADFLIIDGTSNPLENMITLTGLEISDAVIRVMTADVKGIAYMKAAQNIYRDEQFKFDRHITVLGNVKNISPETEIMTVMGSFDHLLNYSYEAENKMMSGGLMKDFGRSDGLKFEKTVLEICCRLISSETDVQIEKPAKKTKLRKDRSIKSDEH